HWNVIANDASDSILASPAKLRIGGHGPVVDRLQWDVKLYLALNGAVHNAAIVAWGLKGKYDSVRPITLIRYMGGLGQSSRPCGGRGPHGLHRLRLLPGWPGVLRDPAMGPRLRARSDDRCRAPVGDLFRCGGPGGPVAPLRRHPHPGRRLHGSPARIALRPERVAS